MIVLLYPTKQRAPRALERNEDANQTMRDEAGIRGLSRALARLGVSEAVSHTLDLRQRTNEETRFSSRCAPRGAASAHGAAPEDTDAWPLGALDAKKRSGCTSEGGGRVLWCGRPVCSLCRPARASRPSREHASSPSPLEALYPRARVRARCASPPFTRDRVRLCSSDSRPQRVPFAFPVLDPHHAFPVALAMDPPAFTAAEESTRSAVSPHLLTPVAEWNALTKEELKQRLLAAEVAEDQATKLVNELSAKQLLMSSRGENFAADLKGLGFSADTVWVFAAAMASLKGAVASCASLSSHAPS